MKLYAEEGGSSEISSLLGIVVSAVARVEVPSALWRKHRASELDAEVVPTLVSDFEDDLFGTETSPRRFLLIAISDQVLDAAARLTGTAGLRAYGAVQLASAEAARAVEPGCDTFACFDASLREAAARSGFALYPRE